jgi:hypothetical protein
VGAQHLHEMVDAGERVARLRRRLARLGRTPLARLHRAPQRDRLRDDVVAAHVHVAHVAQQAGEAVGGVERRQRRQLREPRLQVVVVAPHHLRAEHAVRRRRRAHHVGQPLVERRLGQRRLQPGEQLEHLRIVDALEVLARLARAPAAAQRLEVLVGMAGDAGRVEQIAEQRAAAARRGAEQVGGARTQRGELRRERRIR